MNISQLIVTSNVLQSDNYDNDFNCYTNDIYLRDILGDFQETVCEIALVFF